MGNSMMYYVCLRQVSLKMVTVGGAKYSSFGSYNPSDINVFKHFHSNRRYFKSGYCWWRNKICKNPKPVGISGFCPTG